MGKPPGSSCPGSSLGSRRPLSKNGLVSIVLSQVRKDQASWSLVNPGWSVWDLGAVRSVCPASSPSHRWEDWGGGGGTATL